MVTSETLNAASRLADKARRRHPLESVKVSAADVMEVVNAFLAETKRADVASAKLERAVNDLLRASAPSRLACLN
jgi:hypothetical protein